MVTHARLISCMHSLKYKNGLKYLVGDWASLLADGQRTGRRPRAGSRSNQACCLVVRVKGARSRSIVSTALVLRV